MKRYVEELVDLYADLLRDAEYAYPTLRQDFARDLARITLMSCSRGIPFFMVDLPNLGKHLDRCLANGQYSASGLPTSRRMPGSVGIPNLFRGLYLLIFDIDGSVKDEVDYTAILFLRTLLGCAKKAEVSCAPEKVELEIAAFLRTDASVPMPSPSWEKADIRALADEHQGFSTMVQLREQVTAAIGTCRGERLLSMLDRVTGYIAATLGPYRPDDWRFAHGPGAVSNVGRTASRYNFISWSDRLETAFPYADSAFSSWSAWASQISPPFSYLENVGACMPSSEEPYSKLIAVKKSLSKPRLIASEPAEHMWCQQNLRDYMYTRCASSWINEFVTFQSQTQNQDLARLGSIDGSLATIDLSAASDRVSCGVVGNAFRGNLLLLQALAATRTRFCLLPNGVEVVVRKYSTMGNATTFPVQSLIFLAVALACYFEAEGLTPYCVNDAAGKVSVFGDDIIVPTKVVGTVVMLLEALGFKINTDKSYWTGHFRESCGVDCYRGIDVTPAFWQGVCDSRKPESIVSSVAVSNNFYSKFFVNTAEGIERRAQGIRIPRVVLGAGTLGYHCFCVPPFYLPRRWNKELQRWEIRIPGIYAKCTNLPVGNDTSLLQYFTERPSKMVAWQSGIRLRPSLKIRTRWVPIAQLSRVEDSLHRGLAGVNHRHK